MTEPVWFEADADRYEELGSLTKELEATEQELLNEALELLLATYRSKEGTAAPIGLLADLHDVQRRFRVMIEELDFIRFTTATSPSYDLGISREALELLSRHYRSIFESSERALKAAGFGPFFKPVV
jgi:hypothetical protein